MKRSPLPSKESSLGRTSLRSELAKHITLAATIVVLMTLLYTHHYSIHHDLAGSLLSGRLALELGNSLNTYSAYFPPVEKAWSSLAVWLNQVTGLRVDLVAVLMTSALSLFSAELAYYIRKKTVGATLWFLVASVIFLLIPAIVFKNVFGLREHIVALGLWPYLVLRVSATDSKQLGLSLRILLGVWMGCTLLFKYLYVLLVLLVEVSDAFLQRRPLLLFRAENLWAGAIVLFYLLLWLGLQPTNREAIEAMVSAISANTVSPMESALRASLQICSATLLLLIASFYGVPTRQRLIAFAAVVGAILVAWAQMRWYTHHLFPVFLGHILWLWLGRTSLPRWFKMFACGLLLLFASDQFRNTSIYQSATTTLKDSLQQEGIHLKDKRVALLALHPSPFNQVIAEQGGIRWTPLVNISYIPAELEPFDRKENAGVAPPPIEISEPGRALLHDQMLRLWEDMPPDVLFMDHSVNWPLRHIEIDWNHLLSTDARFKAILSRFVLVHFFESKGLSYEYYVRTH